MLTLDQQKILDHQAKARREAQEDAQRRNLIEDMRANTVTVSPDAGYDVTLAAAQFGRAMPAETVIVKLKACNSALEFERSVNFPELTGVYVWEWVRNDAGALEHKRLHICGMESGINPEFSILHKGKKRVANPALIGNKTPTRELDWIEVETVVGETRGWRTILVRLLHKGLITESDVTKHFGWTPSRQSEKWTNQTS